MKTELKQILVRNFNVIYYIVYEDRYLKKKKNVFTLRNRITIIIRVFVIK